MGFIEIVKGLGAGDAAGPREARLRGYRSGLAEALFGTSACVEFGYPGKTRRLIIPTMLRVLMRWLADKLDTGERLQRPLFLPHPPAPLRADWALIA